MPAEKFDPKDTVDAALAVINDATAERAISMMAEAVGMLVVARGLVETAKLLRGLIDALHLKEN